MIINFVLLSGVNLSDLQFTFTLYENFNVANCVLKQISSAFATQAWKLQERQEGCHSEFISLAQTRGEMITVRACRKSLAANRTLKTRSLIGFVYMYISEN